MRVPECSGHALSKDVIRGPAVFFVATDRVTGLKPVIPIHPAAVIVVIDTAVVGIVPAVVATIPSPFAVAVFPKVVPFEAIPDIVAAATVVVCPYPGYGAIVGEVPAVIIGVAIVIAPVEVIAA